MTDCSPIRFSATFQVAWRDLDANNHMANISYFSFAAQARSLFFAEHGFGPDASRRGGGHRPSHPRGDHALPQGNEIPREIHRRFSGCRHQRQEEPLYHHQPPPGEDGELRAELRTHFVWMDLESRRAIPAPEPLAQLMDRLPKTGDFAAL